MAKTKIDGSDEHIIHKVFDYLLSELKDDKRFPRGKRYSRIEIIVFLSNRKWRFIKQEVDDRKG